MSRLLTVLLIFAALAGCGYNWLQVQRLQAQINVLKVEVAKRYPAGHRYSETKAPVDAVSPAVESDNGTQDEIDGWNSLAAQHYAAAQKAMAKSDAPLAAKEYGAYMDDKRKALVLEEGVAVRSIDTLRKLAGLKSDSGSVIGKPDKASP